MAVEDKNKYGQYFTPRNVADFMVALLTVSKEDLILEPSCGEGIFLDVLNENGFQNVEGREFDKSLKINPKHKVSYEDYLQEDTNERKYGAIIGNPPYIRWKNLPQELKEGLSKSKTWNTYCTSLSDYSAGFIAKAVNDLKSGGQLVFITPEYWLYTAHSQKLRNHILENGTVDKIYHFDEAKLFDSVTASLIVFRFVKGKKSSTDVWKIKGKKSLFNESLLELITETHARFEKTTIESFYKDKRWALESEGLASSLDKFEESCANPLSGELFPSGYLTIGDCCDIANGMVSGMDKAFQVHLDEQNLSREEKKFSIKVAKAKQLDGNVVIDTTRYIFIDQAMSEEQFRQECPNYWLQLQPFKEGLNNRYDYKNNCKYWEWSFLRNLNTLKKNVEKIFVPCKERIGNGSAFRFTLTKPNVFATQDVTTILKKNDTKESIFYIHSFLRLPIVTEWIKSRGVMRGGVAEFSEAPISSIPFRKIDWQKSKEVKVHDKISKLAMLRFKVEKNNEKQLTELNNQIFALFEKLFNF